MRNLLVVVTKTRTIMVMVRLRLYQEELEISSIQRGPIITGDFPDQLVSALELIVNQ